MCEDADWEQDPIANKLVDLVKQLSDKVQALVVKLTECDRLAQPASNTKDEEASPLVDDAIAKEMVKLK
jgi:hypothetical protein